MKDEPVSPPMWVAGAQNIQDNELRRSVLRAAHENWPRMVAYSKARLDGAVDPSVVLDSVVEAAVEANRKEPIRDFEPYLFKSFVRRARLLFRRSQRVEYHELENLAGLKDASDADFVEDLERHIQLEEAVNLMDERTRTIYTMRVQGFSRKEIGATLGISEDAVRKSFARGIEKVRRIIQERPKNEPRPED